MVLPIAVSQPVTAVGGKEPEAVAEWPVDVGLCGRDRGSE